MFDTHDHIFVPIKCFIGYGNLFTQACTTRREMFVHLNAYNTHTYQILNYPYPHSHATPSHVCFKKWTHYYMQLQQTVD